MASFNGRFFFFGVRTELTLNIKLLCHVHELDMNEMARSEYYKTSV